MKLKTAHLIAILYLLIFEVNAQCDNLIPENSKYGYKERDGRCEGFYDSNVSGFTLQVVSLTKGVISYALNSNEKLRLSPMPLQDFDEISIRGVNFSMDRNYRLDVKLKNGSFAEVPIKDVIQPGGVRPQNFGTFGFVDRSGFRFYVPIVPMSMLMGKVKSKEDLKLGLISNIDIQEVSWRYSVSQNEYCRKYSSPLALPTRIYSRNKPIEFLIPENISELDGDSYVCIQVYIKGVNGLEFNENFRLLIPRDREKVILRH